MYSKVREAQLRYRRLLRACRSRFLGGSASRLIIIVALLVSTSFTVAFGPPTLIESEFAEIPISTATLKLIKNDIPPGVVAKSALLMDATTGQVIYAKNAHERRAQASTTKIMTALVVLERARLDEVVTAGPDINKIEPVVIGLHPGDKLTVEQLLYGMLLNSGNDAAVALAEHVGGSVSKFAEMMNAKAAELGLKDTHFVTPNGLDADGHYTSAYDLAVLTRVAMSNTVFEKIVSTKEYRIEGPVRWIFKNSNRLLDSFPGADGVKTGFTDNAGRCLVASATRKGHRAIAVALNSDTMYEDAGAMLSYLLSNFEWQTLDSFNSPLSDYDQEGGSRPPVSGKPQKIVFPTWQKPYLRQYYSFGGASKQSGAVGVASYYLLGEKIADLELFAQRNQ